MIDWIYSDPVRIGFASGVTRDYQNFLEATKKIVDTSKRFRVVTDVAYNGFYEMRETPACRASPLAPCDASASHRAAKRARPSAHWIARSGHTDLDFECFFS